MADRRFAPTITVITQMPAAASGPFAGSLPITSIGTPASGDDGVSIPLDDFGEVFKFPTVTPSTTDKTAGIFDVRRAVFAKLESKDVDFPAFRKRWAALQDQVGAMMSDLTQKTFGSMELDTLEVSLAITGEGSIGIASSKAEASVVLTFKKKAVRKKEKGAG
ncbi:MAG: hypothetical protein KGL29_07810 [Alphaproteobacteria bacterium]|nr:hypothetical protein [Alphaproteobacteria bacterium]